MRRVSGLAVLLALATCTKGPPPGFSGGAGDRWTFPLVGPLEDGLLLTPVTIGPHGPYLFAIDPDAPVSAVDAELVKEAELRPFNGPHRLDETDTQQPRVYAELVGIELGTLIVERRNAIVVKTGTFDVAGRRIHGLIGRDVLADSLVFGIDRDRGLGHLVTVKSWQKPADAIAISYQELNNRITNAQVIPPPRRLAKAQIGDAGETFSMHLDLGATASQLRASKWDQAKLVARDVAAIAVDEVGSGRRITKVSEPTAVTLGAAKSEHVAFVPYEDKRWDEQDIDGTLGLGFFAPYSVWVSWDAKTYYLTKRTELPLAARVARWDEGPIDNCQNPGCLTVRMIDPLAGKPLEAGKPHPGVVLSLTREEKAGGMDLEVILEAQGHPELPRLIVNLPPHVDRLLDQLEPAFLGTTLVVVDASPFPRKCPGNGGCVDKLAR
ncbi:MAG TPA: hypothetical protein VFQ53_34125 [Kofleriaceae bacterium]|nr:hypothetical protein [Kofleriaceae bacterium]